MRCCGIKEMTNVQNSTVRQMVTLVKSTQSPFIVFSTVRGTNGKDLASYIKLNGLGTATKNKPALNPNSGNMLTVWVWRVDRKALKAFKFKNQKTV